MTTSGIRRHLIGANAPVVRPIIGWIPVGIVGVTIRPEVRPE